MEIKLLLNKVTQDQSATTAEEKAFIGWAHGPAAGADDEIIKGGKLPYLSLRKEDWGGIVVHGPSLSVFQADKEAFTLLQRLKKGESLVDIRETPKGLSAEEIENFVKLIKSYKLNIK